MQFEILLNSRTFNVDYRWIARPAYISDALCSRVRDLMNLLQRAGNLTDEDYLRNIFFFTDDSGGILVRGGYSATTDKFGRQIYSVEGIACPAEDLRRFWYALPKLVAWMTQCPLFRDTWVYRMGEDADLSGSRVDIPELDIEGDELLDEGRLVRECPPYVRECLYFLENDLMEADTVFSFAFIPGGSQLYMNSISDRGESLAVERSYTMQTIREMQPLPHTDCNYFAEAMIRDDCYFLLVEVQRDDTIYMKAYDLKGQIIAQTVEEKLGARGMKMSSLKNTAELLRKKIRLYGYSREV